MLKVNFFRNTSSNSHGSNNEVLWIRAKKCNCSPQRLAKIRVSDLEANSDRMYYKCKFCNFFKWVADKKLIRVGGEFKLHEDQNQLQRRGSIIVSKIEELEKLVMKFVKLVLVVCLFFVCYFYKSKVIWLLSECLYG